MADVWTIARMLKWTQGFFAEHGIETPRLDAEVLLSHLLGQPRIYLYTHFDQPLETGELARFREMVKRRAAREPVAYIIGEKEFMGLTFRVTRDVLVPRPDTEILVQAAIERLDKVPGEKLFADIGTGSGAICLSVLKLLEDSRAVTVDISPAARAVAEENAETLGVADRVEFLTGDLVAPLAARSERYAAILSNPPYIDDADMQRLQPEVRCEPRLALAGGADGLDCYRRLFAEAPALLVPGGFLAVEVGIDEAERVAGLAAANPLLEPERTEILRDYGGIERVVIAWRPC